MKERLAGALAAVLLVVGLGLAEAAHGAAVPTQVRLGPQVGPASTAAGSLVGCASGEVALGGGYDTVDATDATIVHTSRPVPSGTPLGWEVVVSQGTIRPFAVCVDETLSPFSSVQVRAVPGPGAATPTVTEASCLDGERATGGGFDTDLATADTIVHTSRPVPPGDGSSPVGWQIAVTGASSTAYAICAAGGDETQLSVHSRAILASDTTQALAPCDPGDAATGGGFDTDAATAATIVNTSRPFPFTGDATPTGWNAYVTATTGTVYAVCSSDATRPDPSACELEPAPVGCWHFDEESGATAFDSSGLGNRGSYFGTPVLGAPGVRDTAVSLDGVDDHVRVPDSASLDTGSTFTLEGWILRDDHDETHQMFNKGGKGYQLVVMDHFNGNQVWLRKAGVSTIVRTTGSGVPADGRFHHVVATKSACAGTPCFGVDIYIDGVQQPLALVSAQAIENTAFPLFLSATAGGNPIDGDIDEFAVYDEPLTPAQVQERYELNADGGTVVSATPTRATATSSGATGGSESESGSCADIGRADSGITRIRRAGMSCREAKDLVVRGPKSVEAAGMECRIVDEDFNGRVVRITRVCTGSDGRELGYTTLS